MFVTVRTVIFLPFRFGSSFLGDFRGKEVAGKAHPITIDLNEFKLRLDLKDRIELTLHFNSPSRKFYLSVIALVVNEMKGQGKITSIPLERHHDLLALLNDTIGGSAGSSEEESLLSRIYKKWQHALPNLEEAPLFTVLGRKKGYEEGVGKTYSFTDAEKDSWANLFEYKGSHGNVRLKFAVDRIGAGLDDVEIIYEDCPDGAAWEKFVSGLKKEQGKQPKSELETPAPVESLTDVAPAEKSKRFFQRRYRRTAIIGAIVVVLASVTFTIWRSYSKSNPDDIASVEKMAFPLPDGPSIAVLPFVNMSGDPKQEFLCDGMTEAIITALAREQSLFVIARTSTSIYKGQAVTVKKISESLGVRYVLEGSVQRSGDRLRITAQLIDALTGNHLWAKRYDRDLKDIFALQDEITLNVLTSVRVKLVFGGDVLRNENITLNHFRGRQGLECYLKYVEADSYNSHWNIPDNNLARRLCEEIIALSPENPMGYMMLGWVEQHDYVLQNTMPPQKTLERSIELAKKCLAIDDSIYSGHSLLGVLYSHQGDHDKAIAEGERALALNPGGIGPILNHAGSLRYAGRPEEAIPLLQKAIRISPFGPSSLYREFGNNLRDVGRLEEAVLAYKKSIKIAPDNLTAHMSLTATYSLMGRDKEAQAEASEVLRINPKFSVDQLMKTMTYKDRSVPDRIAGALRKTGLK